MYQADAYGKAGIEELIWSDWQETRAPTVPANSSRLEWAAAVIRELDPIDAQWGPPTPTARGFPVVALACAIDTYRDVNNKWVVSARRGILLQPTKEWCHRVIPFQPILPGFAIDTVFYAGLTGLVWFGPGALRVAVRRRRGRCVNCAYNLRGNTSGVCPECGAAIKGGRCR